MKLSKVVMCIAYAAMFVGAMAATRNVLIESPTSNGSSGIIISGAVS